MGQREVVEHLMKHKRKWFCTTQLAKILKTSRNSVTNALKKIREAGWVRVKQVGIHNTVFHKWKGGE